MIIKKSAVIKFTEQKTNRPWSSVTNIKGELVGVFPTYEHAKAFVKKEEKNSEGFFKIFSLGEEVFVGTWGHAE